MELGVKPAVLIQAAALSPSSSLQIVQIRVLLPTESGCAGRWARGQEGLSSQSCVMLPVDVPHLKF